MKLLAGFFLDPLWVILQLRDFVRVQLVFLLELLNHALHMLVQALVWLLHGFGHGGSSRWRGRASGYLAQPGPGLPE